MADTLPSPPESRTASPSIDDERAGNKLSKELDELLEQYLEFLDTYTKLREDLSKTFSAGFFSLAQAQRASTLGAGRRYGQECYDQRMKAQRIVQITKKESHSTVFDVQKQTMKQQQQPVPQDSHKSEDKPAEFLAENSKDIDATPATKAPQRVNQDPALRDPLTWFGILAPPTLRQTQSNFSKAFDEIIPALLTVDTDMKQLEGKIWALRAELNLMSDYGSADVDADALTDTEDVDEKVASLSLTGGTKSPASRVQRFSGRSTHSKSTLLKLGE